MGRASQKNHVIICHHTCHHPWNKKNQWLPPHAADPVGDAQTCPDSLRAGAASSADLSESWHLWAAPGASAAESAA